MYINDEIRLFGDNWLASKIFKTDRMWWTIGKRLIVDLIHNTTIIEGLLSSNTKFEIKFFTNEMNHMKCITAAKIENKLIIIIIWMEWKVLLIEFLQTFVIFNFSCSKHSKKQWETKFFIMYLLIFVIILIYYFFFHFPDQNYYFQSPQRFQSPFPVSRNGFFPSNLVQNQPQPHLVRSQLRGGIQLPEEQHQSSLFGGASPSKVNDESTDYFQYSAFPVN